MNFDSASTLMSLLSHIDMFLYVANKMNFLENICYALVVL